MNHRDDEHNVFDKVAEQYDELHGQTLAISGEPVGYFAQYKIDRIIRLGGAQESVLDYGCGTGNLTELLVENFGQVVGFDPSVGSLGVARKRLPDVEFFEDPAAIAPQSFDLAILAGVLHHVDPAERLGVVRDALAKLKPGGRIVVFEHNPYNPLTRRVVDQCAFDKGVVLLPPREIRRLLKDAGLALVDQDYIVFFPRALARLRVLEPALGFVPVGAQTMTVGTTAL